MASSPWVVEVDEGSFEAAVMQKSNDVPVVIDFWAEWCGPCKMLAPLMEKLAEEYAGKFVLAKLNVDDCPNLAGAFGVQSIPLVVAMVNGKPVDSFVGVIPQTQIRAFLDRVCPSDVDKLIEQGASLAADAPKDAMLKLEEAIKLDPKNNAAKAALADLEFNSGNVDRAKNLVESIEQGLETIPQLEIVRAKIDFHDRAASVTSIDEAKKKVDQNPSHLAARKELGIALAARQQWEEALEVLVGCVERDAAFGKANVKDDIVKIFGIVGSQSELANRYRSRLASALY